jgi:hypothetical protein
MSAVRSTSAVVSDRPGAQGAVRQRTHFLWVALLAAVMLVVAGREVMVAAEAPLCRRLGIRRRHPVDVRLVIHGDRAGAAPGDRHRPLVCAAIRDPAARHGARQHHERHLAGTRPPDPGCRARRTIIEARLALGQDWQRAISDSRREAMRVGMIPIINAMSAAGIVSLPGMMTGQILEAAGTPPVGGDVDEVPDPGDVPDRRRHRLRQTVVAVQPLRPRRRCRRRAEQPGFRRHGASACASTACTREPATGCATPALHRLALASPAKTKRQSPSHSQMPACSKARASS